MAGKYGWPESTLPSLPITCNPCEWRTQASGAPQQAIRPTNFQTSIDQQPDLELLSKEERIRLALQALKRPQEISVRRAAVVYKCQRQPSAADALERSQHAIPTLSHQL